MRDFFFIFQSSRERSSTPLTGPFKSRSRRGSESGNNGVQQPSSPPIIESETEEGVETNGFKSVFGKNEETLEFFVNSTESSPVKKGSSSSSFPLRKAFPKPLQNKDVTISELIVASRDLLKVYGR